MGMFYGNEPVSRFAPFTDGEAAEIVQAWSDRIGPVDGCDDCKVLNHCCAECHDQQMTDCVKRLGSKVRDFKQQQRDGVAGSPLDFVAKVKREAGIL